MTTAQQAEIIERIDMLEALIRSLIPLRKITVQPPNFGATDALSRAADYYQVAPSSVTRRTTNRKLSQARQLAMWMLREVHGSRWTLKEIGVEFRRDHTTVLWSVAQVEKRMETDWDLREYAQGVVDEVTQKGATK